MEYIYCCYSSILYKKLNILNTQYVNFEFINTILSCIGKNISIEQKIDIIKMYVINYNNNDLYKNVCN